MKVRYEGQQYIITPGATTCEIAGYPGRYEIPPVVAEELARLGTASDFAIYINPKRVDVDAPTTGQLSLFGAK